MWQSTAMNQSHVFVGGGIDYLIICLQQLKVYMYFKNLDAYEDRPIQWKNLHFRIVSIYREEDVSLSGPVNAHILPGDSDSLANYVAILV